MRICLRSNMVGVGVINCNSNKLTTFTVNIAIYLLVYTQLQILTMVEEITFVENLYLVRT